MNGIVTVFVAIYLYRYTYCQRTYIKNNNCFYYLVNAIEDNEEKKSPHLGQENIIYYTYILSKNLHQKNNCFYYLVKAIEDKKKKCPHLGQEWT